MPVVDKATHIGITRSDTNSARTTVDENIRKARRATYSLMGTGLHGENGLDPETSISLLKTYILPAFICYNCLNFGFDWKNNTFGRL
jgi:hypothetical protein